MKTRIAVLALLLLSVGSYALAVCPGTLEILNEGLPMGFENEPYYADLEAWGGTPPYTWSIHSGSLPPGLSLNPSTGEITGTPTQTGYWTVCIRLTDSAGCHRTQCFEIYIV